MFCSCVSVFMLSLVLFTFKQTKKVLLFFRIVACKVQLWRKRLEKLVNVVLLFLADVQRIISSKCVLTIIFNVVLCLDCGNSTSCVSTASELDVYTWNQILQDNNDNLKHFSLFKQRVVDVSVNLANTLCDSRSKYFISVRKVLLLCILGMFSMAVFE